MTNEADETNKSQIAQREEKILNFWEENNIFKKTIERESTKGDFVFYDGPPFATGLPHYGHILPGTIKDIIPRYKTMTGYKVSRRWGWDTHGLPIENLIQKENNLKTKQDVENFGVKNFNEAARASVFRYLDEWKKIIPRTGRWVDFEDNYITMDSKYMESVWWMWKTLHQKGLAYEGFKSMHISPLLETALSNFEVNQAYKDITDLSATVKFELAEEKGTFVLAWTTTPWTLPGNVALAINKNLSYVKVKFENAIYIAAKDLVEKVFVGKEHEVVSEISAEELLGKKYTPPFNCYIDDATLENRENGWKIYHGDFVTTTDGTGVVHIAPAFGEDDLNLGKENNLPFVQHVKIDGTIKPEVKEFAGLQAKPKEDPMQTDIEFVKYLAHNGFLFDKKKYTHSYPHCWRTDAPLLNYAMSSWYIKVTSIKDKIVKENEKVNWTPDFVGKNRFGNWLKDAKDWSVSRARFWGTPIPIWKSEDGNEIAVIGSIDDLKEKTKSTNTFVVMRHGEADHNLENRTSDSNNSPSHLTQKGKDDVARVGEKFADEKFDEIYCSPLFRTKETAEIVAEKIGYPIEKIIVDERLKEIQTGFDGRPISEYRDYLPTLQDRFEKCADGAETVLDLKKRVGNFLKEIDSQNENKRIIIVTHEYPTWALVASNGGLNKEETIAIKEDKEDFIATGKTLELIPTRLPLNDNFEIDLHRPYIDDVTFMQNGKLMKRIPDVFDTWVDSGSVPYASNYYPANKERFSPDSGLFKKSKNYPADFIAEGLDQTRGWFYSLLVLNTALFGRAPYKNVVVNGLVLAEDGKKMSKSLNNFPDISTVLNKTGADSLRYFLMSSPAVKSDDVAFSEKGVAEIASKLISRLDNVVSFYEMYKDFSKNSEVAKESTNILDQWILSRLSELQNQVTVSLDNYEIDRATRPFMDFVDDLSTWYIRRSRDRFKNFDEENEDAVFAAQTTKFVLKNLSKLIAPFTPFIAEDIYQKVREKNDFESVHLDSWPQLKKSDEKIISSMQVLRDTVTRALDERTKVGIKVRQPLASVTLKKEELKNKNDLLEILKDELNVKDVLFNINQDSEVSLDTNLTEELRLEGNARELIRFIQQLRKTSGYKPNDEISMIVSASAKIEVGDFVNEIQKSVRAKEIKFEDNDGETVKVGDIDIAVKIKKVS
ncbi:MAG: class I tRNA ligase family protein [Candidatus Paceibacterota bacterium]